MHCCLAVSVERPFPIHAVSLAITSAVLAVCLVLAGAEPVAADLWYQHYQKAKEALDRQEWESAVEELNQAIARRGDSGARVRTYGMRTTDYFPYLDLGIAYLNLGQPEAAVQAFETEERLGAISASEQERQRLEQFRAGAQAQIAAHRAKEQQRIEQILSDSVAEAEKLAARGDLDEAMVALGRGLAVSPEDPGATELMEKLRDDARRLEAERRVASQVEGLVTQGQSFLDQGAFEKAASRFRQALALRPGDIGVQKRLDETQSLLKEAMREEAATGEPALDVDEALREAVRLEQAGQLDEALSILQSVLVLEPRDVRAKAQEERVLAARERALKEAGNRSAAEEEIAAASAHFSAGRFEASLSAANRALAFSPGNPSALELVTRSYREISRVLLGRSMGGNIPPAIRFADFRHDHSGQYLQAVSDPEFRLAGMVIDNSPVMLEVTDGREQVLPVEVDSQQLGDFYLTEFQVDVDLEVGQQTLRVVATDAEALSASSEYAVLYQRPRLRSPWFLALLAAVLIGLLGAVAIARSRRRARRRQRRFNPYVAGAPVLDEDLFFGRNRLIDRILQTIHNNSLLLYGERRIGKTSIQHHLKKRLLELQDPIYDFYPVYVDLQGTPEDRFFATIAEDVFQQLAGEVDLPAEHSFEDDQADYTYRDLVRDLRSVIRQLAAGSGKKVKLVLLIDEVDELNDYDPRINQRLRSLFMKSFAESLVAVVSGVEIKKHWERVGSPWYNFFEEIEVLPLDDEEARKLIERPIAGVLRIQDGVVERILEVTGKRPYLIQKMCVALVNQAYERGSTVIAIEDVDAVTPVEVP